MLQEDTIEFAQVDSFSVLAPKPSPSEHRDFSHEGYFAGSPYFHPELGVSRSGIAGDPVPYSFSGDNAVVGLVLALFLLMLLSVVRSWSFIVRQTRLFFHVPRRIAEASDTGSELRHQNMLFVLGSVVFGTGYFLYRYVGCGERFVLEPHVAVMGLFSAAALVVLMLRVVVYSFVNWVFFNKTQCEQWQHASLFLTATLGVLLFPAVVAMVFFTIPANTLFVYTVSVLVLVELLSILRCFVIFFKGSAFSLQIILYFCTLELIPLAFLWALWGVMAGYLATNI